MCLGPNDPGGPRQCPSHTKCAVEAKEKVRDELAERIRLYQADLAMIEHGMMQDDAGAATRRLEEATEELTAVNQDLQDLYDKLDSLPPEQATVPGDLEAVRAHYAQMSPDELRDEIAQRTSSEEYAELLAARDAARERKDQAQEAFSAASKAVDDTDPDSLEALQQARNELYDAHCDLQVANVPVEEYKNHTAQAAAELSKSVQLTEWEGDKLGDLYRHSEHEEGSLAWHADRHGHIGGSDVGALTGEDKDAYLSASDIKASKLAPLDEEAIAAQQDTMTNGIGPAARGHAWEPVIINDYATEHPDDTVLHTKATWRHPDKEYVNINVDGVLSSDGQTPDGIIDAKTGSDAAKFADGIPVGYRAQLAYYLHNAGLKRGVIAAKIDDGPTRYFSMSVDEPISGVEGGKTIADYDDKMQQTWEKWQAEAANPPAPKPNKGTFAWVKKPGSDSSKAKNAAIARDLAAYRGISEKRATQLIENNVYQGKSADAAVRDLYSSYDPATTPNRRFVTLDFETNSRSAGKGEVIQTGVVVTDGNGKVLERIDDLHGIDSRIAGLQGTGETAVHGISTDDVAGKAPFQKSQAHARVKELLADPRCTLVAHNAQFEKQWLRANGIGAPRVIDTMRLHQRFAHGTCGSTNRDFCLDNNVEYVNGHNAAADADMTSRAFHHFTKKLFSTSA